MFNWAEMSNSHFGWSDLLSYSVFCDVMEGGRRPVYVCDEVAPFIEGNAICTGKKIGRPASCESGRLNTRHISRILCPVLPGCPNYCGDAVRLFCGAFRCFAVLFGSFRYFAVDCGGLRCFAVLAHFSTGRDVAWIIGLLYGLF